jgi:dephospho-CoA kinase
MPKRTFLGLTGLPGAGKGEFVSAIRDLVTAEGTQFVYFSLSDVLRDIAARSGEPYERQTLNEIGNELRRNYGNGVLAIRVLESINQEVGNDSNSIILIDAIRRPEEAEVFRQNLGGCFLLVAIDAPVSLLAERISQRRRNDESKAALQSTEAALTLLSKEAGVGEPSYGLDIRATIKTADETIKNTGSILDLRRKIAALVSKYDLC